MLKPILVYKNFKSRFWLAGSIAAIQSQAMLANQHKFKHGLFLMIHDIAFQINMFFMVMLSSKWYDNEWNDKMLFCIHMAWLTLLVLSNENIPHCKQAFQRCLLVACRYTDACTCAAQMFNTGYVICKGKSWRMSSTYEISEIPKIIIIAPMWQL